MKEKQKLIIYSQLLSDELFIKWVINPTQECDLYWQKKIESNQEIRENIEGLRDILKKLRVDESKLTNDEKQEIWSKIESAIIKKKTRKVIVKSILIKVASAAAMILLTLGSLWFFILNDRDKNNIDYASIINDKRSDLGLTADDVTLVLSNQKQMKMKSDSTKVIYDSKGRIKVNSEDILTDEDSQMSINQLIVPYGKTTFLTLSDGTKVWINSGSKMAYPSVFDNKKREVYIMGEAYFDVAKNEKHPFIIKTVGLDLIVKGTQLNVTAYNNDSKEMVVLVSGKVDVNERNKNTSHSMVPNQLFTHDLESKETGMENVDVTRYISWIDGYLLLESESLDRLLAKIDRHYNITTKYDKNEIQKIRVSGKLDMKKEIDKVFDYICMVAPISYQIDGKEVAIKLKQ